jgi:transposase-like protein
LIRVVGREVVWLWIAIEPKSKSILDMRISLERSILVAEQFLQELIKKYGKNPVSTDGGGTWYLSQACRIFEITSSHSLIILRKKYHRTNYSIHKR